MDGIAMEGPLPPLTKINKDDVDGVEVEVVLVGPSNKSMRTLYGKDRVKLTVKRGKKRGRS